MTIAGMTIAVIAVAVTTTIAGMTIVVMNPAAADAAEARDVRREDDGDQADKDENRKGDEGKNDKGEDDKSKDDKSKANAGGGGESIGQGQRGIPEPSQEPPAAGHHGRGHRCALLLIAYGIYYYLSHKNLVGTDDAYTDGYIVAVAPRISGQVVSLDVVDNQFVHKGDALVHIDPRPFMFDRDQAKGKVDSDKAQIASQKLGVEISKKNFPAALQLAQANLDSAKSNLALQEANNNRQKGLPKQATTQQEVDTTSSSYQQAESPGGAGPGARSPRPSRSSRTSGSPRPR